MRLTDKAWRAANGFVKEGTVSDFTRGDSTCSEFFTDEADAYDALADQEESEANHKQLGADEARARAIRARRKASEIREART